MNKITFLISDLNPAERLKMDSKIREVYLLKKRLQNSQRLVEGNSTVLERQLQDISQKVGHLNKLLLSWFYYYNNYRLLERREIGYWNKKPW
jgi:hypothetical protein